MSATICWELCAREHDEIYLGAPSAFLDALEEAAMLDTELSGAHVAALVAMAAAWRGSYPKAAEAIDMLVGQIKDGHNIRVWATQ